MEHDISIKGEQKVREECDQVMTSVTASMRERKEKQEHKQKQQNYKRQKTITTNRKIKISMIGMR